MVILSIIQVGQVVKNGCSIDENLAHLISWANRKGLNPMVNYGIVHEVLSNWGWTIKDCWYRECGTTGLLQPLSDKIIYYVIFEMSDEP